MSNDGNIIDFSKLKKAIKTSKEQPYIEATSEDNSEDIEDMLIEGLDNFLTQLEEGVTGFVTVVFKDGFRMPEVTIAGDIEPLKTIGTLDYVKNGITQQMLSGAFITDDMELLHNEYERIIQPDAEEENDDSTIS